MSGRHLLPRALLRSLPVLLAVLFAAGGGRARADDADAVYKRGVELRKERKDAEALDAFKQLNALEKSPRSLAQMGLAEQALGMWVEAEGHLNEAVKVVDNPWIKKNRHVLDGALVDIDSRLGHVDVWGEPVGAEVLIDGKVVGGLPLLAPVPVVVGSIPITVRAPGYLERSTVVVVKAKESSRERIVLQRAEAPPAPAATQPSPKVAIATDPAVASPPPVAVVSSGSETPPPSAQPWNLRASAKWVAWGAGAAALGVGIFGAVSQNSDGNDFDASCGLSATGVAQPLPGSTKTAAQCQALRSSTDSGFRLEVIGFVAAGALAATGLVLWLTEPHVGPEQSAGLVCAPGFLPGSALSASCALRF